MKEKQTKKLLTTTKLAKIEIEKEIVHKIK
jgi:hypothetical protein